jgi:methylase of polypeptide subunit release factors
LDGGGDGLDFTGLITADFREVLNPGGGLFYEVASTRRLRWLHAIMRQYGFEKIGFVPGYAG